MTVVPRTAEHERAGYLREVCQLLWPPPASATPRAGRPASSWRPSRAGRRAAADPDGPSGAGQPGAAELIVLPGLRDPRLLVPAERLAGAAAVRGYGEPGSARARLAGRVLGLALISGAGGLLMRDRVVLHVPAGAAAIDAHLSAVLGRQVRLSMHLRAARANRKPVLRLLTPDGLTVGYAKIGVNPLTTALIDAEHAALEHLAAAGLRELSAPRVLDRSAWQGLDVLVLSPLPVWQRRIPLRPGQLAAAMAELAAASGGETCPLLSSRYWRRLHDRLDAADAGSDQASLRAALSALADQAEGARLRFGAWHGDWTPWNMASTPGGLLVWDWERFAAGVPVGFDALHYWLQSQVAAGRRDPAEAAARCVRQAPALLAPLRVGPDEARLTALAYLADLSLRYLADRQEQAGARLGAPSRWLLPALTAAAGAR